MADVRSLLRNERAARQIEHPYASYSTTGTLQCTVCRIPVKSDPQVWNKHLKSSQHAMRVERLRVASGQPANASNELEGDARLLQAANKKRKADVEEDDSRKKTRQTVEKPRGIEDDVDDTTAPAHPVTDLTSRPRETAKTPPSDSHSQSQAAAINEDEWAAFERDLARPPSPEGPSALTATATIIAAPSKSSEANVDTNTEDTDRKGNLRDLEAEAEKEDATRALEEEFDEMEELEERVKRLREKRESLRMKFAGQSDQEEAVIDTRTDHVVIPAPELSGSNVNTDEESDEDLDDWGSWGRP